MVELCVAGNDEHDDKRAQISLVMLCADESPSGTDVGRTCDRRTASADDSAPYRLVIERIGGAGPFSAPLALACSPPLALLPSGGDLSRELSHAVASALRSGPAAAERSFDLASRPPPACVVLQSFAWGRLPVPMAAPKPVIAPAPPCPAPPVALLERAAAPRSTPPPITSPVRAAA